MAGHPEISNMALFCDFENIALGVRDAKYAQFDIKRVLERLLLKGSIVVKKAYCDWERYKEFKATMHEAAFELIEIPHVRQSGKNSADIRMVVDALDLCYTKSHVDAFVIISGDSDFSPLVSKLRENNKYVIGIGVKDSTSDLLSANCDEFIFYDDLVRAQEAKQKRRARKAPAKEPAAQENRRAATRKSARTFWISSWKPWKRSSRNAARTKRSGARWSRRQCSAAAPASPSRTTATVRSRIWSRTPRNAACSRSCATTRPASTPSGCPIPRNRPHPAGQICL
jgi:uncharacterized protein (TIGR00288 family)